MPEIDYQSSSLLEISEIDYKSTSLLEIPETGNCSDYILLKQQEKAAVLYSNSANTGATSRVKPIKERK